jgi:hypothetical protein
MKGRSGRMAGVLFAQAMPMTPMLRATGAVHSTKDDLDRGGLAQTHCSYAAPLVADPPVRASSLKAPLWLSLRVQLGPWPEIRGLLFFGYPWLEGSPLYCCGLLLRLELLY